MHTTATHLTHARRPMLRSRRRALVVATYVGYAAFLAVLYAGYTAHWPLGLGVLALLLFGGTALAFVQLIRAPGYAADTLDARLDERQRQVRDRAYRSAYYALTLLFGVLSLIFMYAAGSDTSWQGIRDQALLLPWLTFLPGSLPTAVVAWTEPDPPADY